MKAWLVLLLAAAVVSAQEVTDTVHPAGFGAAAEDADLLLHGADLVAPGPIVNSVGGGILAGASIVDLGGRKMLSQRSLRGIDGDGTNVVINSTANVYSNVGKNVCPTTNTAWAAWESYSNSTEYTMYGDLVHDAAICNTTAAGVGKVVTTANATGVFYGGAAQDFGTSRPNWESYGWSLFKLQDPPAATNLDHVKIQGLTLHVIGNVGTGHGSGVECGIKGVSVAIYNANQTSPYDPVALNYTKYIDLTNAAAAGTFKWTTNRTGALYIDIGVAPDAYPRFANSTYHWLRVKLHADYTGYDASATTGRCFAFWGVSSTVSNDVAAKSRWQERVGGASGYSTTCVGAANSGNSTIVTSGGASLMNIPGQYQTWWNCWNNGLNTLTGNTGRRCSTYRATVVPPIPSLDCLQTTRAQFHDYNYAFSGYQGQSGLGEDSGQNGAGGAK